MSARQDDTVTVTVKWMDDNAAKLAALVAEIDSLRSTPAAPEDALREAAQAVVDALDREAPNEPVLRALLRHMPEFAALRAAIRSTPAATHHVDPTCDEFKSAADALFEGGRKAERAIRSTPAAPQPEVEP